MALNTKNLFSHGSGGGRSKIRTLREWASLRPLSLSGRHCLPPCLYTLLFFAHIALVYPGTDSIAASICLYYKQCLSSHLLSANLLDDFLGYVFEAVWMSSRVCCQIMLSPARMASPTSHLAALGIVFCFQIFPNLMDRQWYSIFILSSVSLSTGSQASFLCSLPTYFSFMNLLLIFSLCLKKTLGFLSLYKERIRAHLCLVIIYN